MYLEIQQKVREKFAQVVHEVLSLEIEQPILEVPPRPEMGDLSIAACFELAKQLRQPPRRIAEHLAPRLLPLAGVERVSVAGAGYLNFHLDRAKVASALYRLRAFPPSPESVGEAFPALSGQAARPREGKALADKASPPSKKKILVEHTSINPNKAAHIGHLRNAVLGDTFVRLLRFRGDAVEIQNYIDNTGVQVADVVVGFIHLEKKKLADVEKLVQDPAIRFDYFCWDLYARVSQLFEENKDALDLRLEVLKAIEQGQGEIARMGELISQAVVRLHLETMRRINVQYDLLVQESEILRLDFWKSAFELLKKKGAIRYETAGKNAGCWVMRLEEEGSGETGQESAGEDIKIIVRSNATVTYVGKDIAYHLWKFGLLGKDFGYEVFCEYPDGHKVWQTAPNQTGRSTTLKGQSTAPAFGRAAAAYSVIDTRQSYLQNLIATAFRTLGFHEQAANLHHFAYEVVGLSPRCAEDMGLELSEEDRQRSYMEVSGRKGQGIKADDLIDTLVEKALEEVRAREMTRDVAEQETYARKIAVGALRYFMLKYSCRAIIAFDFKEALAFEGETGPYLQYSVVRARNIFRKFQEAHPEFSSRLGDSLGDLVSADQLKAFLTAEHGLVFWELTHLAAQLEMMVDQAISTTEPAVLAKYAFRLAQTFNNFYHRYHILSEPDAARQNFLLYLVHLVSETLIQTLDLLGIEVPERM